MDKSRQSLHSSKRRRLNEGTYEDSRTILDLTQLDDNEDDRKLPAKQPFDRLAILRTIWYVVHAVLRDSATTQQKGVVFLAYPQHAKLAQFDRHLEGNLTG